MQVYTLTSASETKIGETKIELWNTKIIKIKKEVALRCSNDDYQSKTSKMEFSSQIKRYNSPRYFRNNIPRYSSNAFYKMWEMLNFVNFEKQELKTKDLVHFDNAAFPGDFIRAVERYTLSVIKSESTWYANSLLPDTETILGDRYKLYENNPDRWVMSLEHGINGDVRDIEMCNKIAIMMDDENISLYTSDLGIPFQDRFQEEQEHLDANIGQVYLGLKVLQLDGVFIVKMFSAFTIEVRQLISYIFKQFKQTYIIKPETSKPDNSEMYICGIGYNGYNDDLKSMNKLKSILNNTPLIKLSEIISELTYRQIKKIKDNISKYDNNWEPPVYPFKTITSWMTNQKLIVDMTILK